MAPATESGTAEQAPVDERRPYWLYARIIRRLRPRGARLLQVACGGGSLLRLLTDHYEVYGFDIEPRARNLCRVAVPGALVIEDWETRPELGFDVVVSIGAFGRKGARAQIRALLPCLARDGVLVLIVPHPGGWAARLKGRAWGISEADGEPILSEGQWMTVIRDLGLRLVAACGDGLWDAPYVRVVPADAQLAAFEAVTATASLFPWPSWALPRRFGESLVLMIERG